MFDVGFWELVIIGIIALLVVGPDKLPGLLREIMKWVRTIRRFVTTTKRELETELMLDAHKDFPSKLEDLEDLLDIAPDKQPDQNRSNDAETEKPEQSTPS
jgi:sec-independent protein translocase protein TatB